MKALFLFIIGLFLSAVAVMLAYPIELRHSLSKTPMFPSVAAKAVKFSGPVDSAYRIGEVIVIVSDGVHHAFGRGKRSFSQGRSNQNIEKDAVDETPKELNSWSGSINYDSCNQKLHSEKMMCWAELDEEQGYFSTAILSLSLAAKKLAGEIVAGKTTTITIDEIKTEMCRLYGKINASTTADQRTKYKSEIEMVARTLITHQVDCIEWTDL